MTSLLLKDIFKLQNMYFICLQQAGQDIPAKTEAINYFSFKFSLCKTI